MTDETDKKIKKELRFLPDISVVRLDNTTCTYCGVALEKKISTKEHVIGRRFVPKGKLYGNWNLIVNACKSCNSAKSDLEDDISAITLQPDAFGSYSHDDESAAIEAHRKAAKAYSRRTKRLVKESQETFNVDFPLSDIGRISFKFTAPPQADEVRIFALAQFQIMGFFYWITFDRDSKRGRFWRGGFYPVLVAKRSDWGNPVHRAFADTVVTWEPRVLATSANGFYKIAIRRHPDAECWSWAIEWNHALRTIGFFGDWKAYHKIVSILSELDVEKISIAPDNILQFRIETPLETNQIDNLFHWNLDS